jgi:ATP-dependent helicase/nuclease subunit B
VRPRQFSATSLETLLRDPYVIYAKQILKLKKLEPLGALPEAREFGIAAHAALENFALEKGWQRSDTLAFLLENGRNELEIYMQYSPMIHALWWPRFERVAEWIMAQGWPEHIMTEQQGIWQMGDYTLTARLDRMDVSESGYKIIDYKTGTPPSPKDIALGLGIQLTLTAAMVEMGCFGEEVQHKPLDGLTYWVLSGGMKGGITKDIPMKDAPRLVAELKEKLPRMLAEYESPHKAYIATPDRRSALRYNDYQHLERIAEWGGQ